MRCLNYVYYNMHMCVYWLGLLQMKRNYLLRQSLLRTREVLKEYVRVL